MYFSWYHMFSEGSLTWKTFRESIKITKKKIIPIFFSVLFFSIIIWTITSAFELGFSQIFSIFGADILLYDIVKIMTTLSGNIETMVLSLQ